MSIEWLKVALAKRRLIDGEQAEAAVMLATNRILRRKALREIAKRDKLAALQHAKSIDKQ